MRRISHLLERLISIMAMPYKNLMVPSAKRTSFTLVLSIGVIFTTSRKEGST